MQALEGSRGARPSAGPLHGLVAALEVAEQPAGRGAAAARHAAGSPAACVRLAGPQDAPPARPVQGGKPRTPPVHGPAPTCPSPHLAGMSMLPLHARAMGCAAWGAQLGAVPPRCGSAAAPPPLSPNSASSWMRGAPAPRLSLEEGPRGRPLRAVWIVRPRPGRRAACSRSSWRRAKSSWLSAPTELCLSVRLHTGRSSMLPPEEWLSSNPSTRTPLGGSSPPAKASKALAKGDMSAIAIAASRGWENKGGRPPPAG